MSPARTRRYGASAATAWTGSREAVSLVRPPVPPRPVRLATHTDVVELDVHRSALVVVDMQNDFCHPKGWFAQKGVSMRATRKPIPVLTELLPAWRHAGGRVVWLNWGVRPDAANLSPVLQYKAMRPDADGRQGVGYAQASPLDHGPSVVAGSWGAQVVAELPVAAGDLSVFKHRLSGFWDNELDSLLRQQGITTLLFGGVNTDRCVFASLQDASFLGYDCVLLKDACGTPSPAYVTRAIHFLVDKLHGFVGTAEALIPALTASAALHPAPAISSSKKDTR
ncbi:cysteine hydrolase [Aquincola tertiaricarbonis]|uniref:Cysteine hydrolase n=1 Tax=Aquincola tertiaricarbonis TaxID=391953 RepID=A0ABY4SHT4_AQUTE|nr:isochorismatase family cysteine hydrolase [Aquincola tertiaricarbonis]URI11472.1 cysteine hydrolase [Aquincola tertiaricarbonis]